MSTVKRAIRQWLPAAALALVLAAAFMAYLRPGFIVDLANRVILCF